LVGEIVSRAASDRVPVRTVARARFDDAARTQAPQGVLAHAEPVAVTPLDELAAGRAPFLVVFDGLTDPQNLGALLRTAEVAGATGAVLPRHRSAHLSPAAVKAAAGAVEHLRFALVPGVPAALLRLGELGVWRVGLDAGGDRSVFELELGREPLALVVGAEGAGLSRLGRARCDVVAAVPQAGALPSLNVAAAGAVACFHILRGRQ
ncbi:MAG TPA: RNA methyltransferase, partial [Acidimicrobiales bacterium]